MATRSLPDDPAELRERVLNVVRRLLDESGCGDAVPALALTSDLDSDLGLKSVERVELVGRLEIEFGVILPEHVLAEAKTPEDFAQALLALHDAPSEEKVHAESEEPFAAPGYPLKGSHAKSVSAAKRSGGKLAAGIRRAGEILYGIYFGIVFVIWVVPCWLIVLFFRDRHQAARFTSAALKLLFALIFCPIRVVGREYMQTAGAKIYAANHTSYFDVLPVMAALTGDYRFVAKREVLRMPFIGTFLRRLGHLSFKRESARSRLRQLGEMEDFLRNGESIFMFPEGTFSGDDGIRPFHLGAFKASLATGAPIIPVSLEGTRKFLRDGTFLPRPTKVTITISPPIYPRFTAADVPSQVTRWQEVIRLKNETREAISRHTNEPLL